MTEFRQRDIISIKEFNKEEIALILKKTAALKRMPEPRALEGKVLGSCFFEPSTRTRLSFETAMQRLGGNVIGFADPSITSTKKGETLADTIKMVSGYADAIVLRHPLDGAARRAAEATDRPVINAGDGANQHPTQTLLDLFTIKECQGRLEHLNIAMVGDLKYGRTVHSLASALQYFAPTLLFVAPEQLQMPSYICDDLKRNGIPFSFHQTIEEIMERADIIYMTRIQEERFADRLEYERLKNVYVLKKHMLKPAKATMRIMHPLPRVNEIAVDVDDSPHAYYFQQAQNGLFTRQALLSLILQ